MSEQPSPAAVPSSYNTPKNTVRRSTFVAGLALMAVAGCVVGTRSDIIVGYLQGVRVSSDTLNLQSVQETYRKLKAN